MSISRSSRSKSNRSKVTPERIRENFEHTEGRAFDWRVNVNNAKERGYAYNFIARVRATDSAGHTAARGPCRRAVATAITVNSSTLTKLVT